MGYRQIMNCWDKNCWLMIAFLKFEIAGTCWGKTSHKMTLDLENDMFFLLKPFLGCSKTKSIRYRLSDAQLSKNCCRFNDLPTVPLGSCGQKHREEMEKKALQLSIGNARNPWHILASSRFLSVFPGRANIKIAGMFVMLIPKNMASLFLDVFWPTNRIMTRLNKGYTMIYPGNLRLLPLAELQPRIVGGFPTVTSDRFWSRHRIERKRSKQTNGYGLISYHLVMTNIAIEAMAQSK